MLRNLSFFRQQLRSGGLQPVCPTGPPLRLVEARAMPSEKQRFCQVSEIPHRRAVTGMVVRVTKPVTLDAADSD